MTQPGQSITAWPVGTRVVVRSPGCFCDGEKGTVVAHIRHGNWVGVSVKLDHGGKFAAKANELRTSA